MLKLKIQIDGVTIKDDSSSSDPNLLTTWEYERTSEIEISELNFNVLKTIGDLVTLTSGKSVSCWMGHTTSTDEKIFEGYISKHKVVNGIIEITCKDKMWDLVRLNVNKVYEESGPQSGQISAIAKDLIETYGGLTSDEVATGTADGETIAEFRCDHTDIYERLRVLAKAVDYQLWYDAVNDTVHFEPRGYNDSGETLTVGTEIVGLPEWENDTSLMVNDLRVDGAVAETQTRFPIGTGVGQIGTTADFDTTDITLTKTPQSVELIMDASTPPTEVKVGGTKDSSSGHFYYVDTENKKIMPTEGTSFTSSHYAIVNYTWLAPAPIHQYNASSIATYGKFEKQTTLLDIKSVADAEVRTAEILAKFSSPFLVGDLAVKNLSTLTYKVGDKVTVIDSISSPNIDQQFVVTRETIKYPSSLKEIVVGDMGIRLADWQINVEDRIKKLEENTALQNQDLLLELVDFSNEEIIEPRYRQIIKETMTDGDNFILGHPSMGILGTDLLGRQADASENHFIQQYEDIYTEDFIDDDFEGTGGATWTGGLDFTSSQIGRSTSIDFNNGTITQAKLTPTEVSGSFDYQLTAAGTSWEKVAIPYLHYKMNDNLATTNVIDSMGHLDGTASQNTEDMNTPGKINAALYFDGSDRVSLPNDILSGTTAFSFCTWVKFETNSGTENPITALSFDWTGDKGVLIVRMDEAHGSTPKQFSMFFGNDTFTFDKVLENDTWYHLAVTHTGTTTKLYIDGAFEQSMTTESLITGGLFDAIGGGSSKFMKGKQDDVRIYLHDITVDEISDLYNRSQGTETSIPIHTFTTPGTNLKWSATENKSSTGEISQIKIEEYH